MAIAPAVGSPSADGPRPMKDFMAGLQDALARLQWLTLLVASFVEYSICSNIISAEACNRHQSSCAGTRKVHNHWLLLLDIGNRRSYCHYGGIFQWAQILETVTALHG